MESSFYLVLFRKVAIDRARFWIRSVNRETVLAWKAGGGGGGWGGGGSNCLFVLYPPDQRHIINACYDLCTKSLLILISFPQGINTR